MSNTDRQLPPWFNTHVTIGRVTAYKVNSDLKLTDWAVIVDPHCSRYRSGVRSMRPKPT